MTDATKFLAENTEGACPELYALNVWAAAHNLSLSVSVGTQQEPEHVVAVRDEVGWLTRDKSRDSVETATYYLRRKLRRLGIDV